MPNPNFPTSNNPPKSQIMKRSIECDAFNTAEPSEGGRDGGGVDGWEKTANNNNNMMMMKTLHTILLT